MAEVEYQVDEMLFKMNALAGTANLPEKPANYFTDSSDTTTAHGGDAGDVLLTGVLTGGGRCNIDGVSSAGQAAILRMYQVRLCQNFGGEERGSWFIFFSCFLQL